MSAYTFDKKVAGFTVARIVLYKGDEQKWIFDPVHPKLVRGLSIIESGSILYSISDYSKVLNSGDTAWDCDIISTLNQDAVTLSILSPYAVRYCVTPSLITDKFSRDIYEMQPGDTHAEPTDTCIVILSGEINFCNLSMSAVTYKLLPANEVLTATISSKILINRIIV